MALLVLKKANVFDDVQYMYWQNNDASGWMA
jgi:hypothetical protein